MKLTGLISFGLVGLQFGLCTTLVALVPWSTLLREGFPWFGSSAASWLWMPCVLAGAFLGMWAWYAIGIRRLRIMPEPGAKTQLITSGPYRYIRHPMYTGLLSLMAGLALLALNWPSGIAWAMLVVVLDRKALREERFLQMAFAEYHNYMRRTGKFFPRLWNNAQH